MRLDRKLDLLGPSTLRKRLTPGKQHTQGLRDLFPSTLSTSVVYPYDAEPREGE